MEGRRPLNVAFAALAVVLLLGKQEIRLQAADAEIGEAASNCLKKHTSDIELLYRGDPDWNAIRSGSLLRVDLEPAVIVVVRKTADIQASVYCAMRLSIPVVPRAGGHSFEGLSSTAGGILVYLGEHNEVLDFDEEKPIMKMAPGASLGPVYCLTWNMTFGGGTCPQVGLAGHVLCVGLDDTIHAGVTSLLARQDHIATTLKNMNVEMIAAATCGINMTSLRFERLMLKM